MRSGAVDIAVKSIAADYLIDPQLVYSNDRHGTVVLVRKLACLAVRDETRMSFPEIGRYLGNRDHTTIMSAVASAQRLVVRDERAEASVERARQTLKRVMHALPADNEFSADYARLAAIDAEISRLQNQRAEILRQIDKRRAGLVAVSEEEVAAE